MKGYIIGIAGELGSGKDTLASMINYIVSVGIANAGYADYVTNRTKYDLTNADRITHFADPMKDCLSIMYNIPRPAFDDRVKKDVEWWSLKERIFVTERDAVSSKYVKINMPDLQLTSLSTVLDILANMNTNKIPLIRLRTLMQYFGTEIGRDMMGLNLWVDATMGKAAHIAETRRICLIPDMRFINEHQGVTGNFLYGGDIYIHRDQGNLVTHGSENIDFKCKYTVDNNGSKLTLLYKAINIVTDIFNNKS